MVVHKPLLPIGQQPAIARTVRSVAEAGVVPLVVLGHRGEDIERTIEGSGAVFARNAEFVSGMFSSVTTGARVIANDPNAGAFFLLPADCCAIAPETFRRLIEEFESHEEILYPKFNGKRGHPPMIPASLAGGLMKHVPDNTGARGYFEQYPSRFVEVVDAGILLDMDTPRDYAEMLRYLRFPTFPEISRAYSMFAEHETAADIIAHGEQTAQYCRRAGEALNARGAGINVPLLEVSALLHDICRAEDEHAERGFELLLRAGYPDTAILVRGHMEPPPEGASSEAEILYIFDKILRRGEVLNPAETLKRLQKRFADDPDALCAATVRMEACSKLLKKYEKRYSVSLMNV